MERNELLNKVKNKAGMNGLSELMNNRTLLQTAEIYNKELTIESADIVNYDGKQYAVIVPVEYPDKFINGGKALTELVNAIYETAEEELSDANAEHIAEFIKAMAIKFTATPARTKSGKNFTKIDIK